MRSQDFAVAWAAHAALRASALAARDGGHALLGTLVLRSENLVLPSEHAMGTRVTRKGQVTIPKRVRDHLGIEPGSVVEFKLANDGRIVLVKAGATPEPSRFARVRGTATVELTTDEIMAMLRGDD
jgi:AbrB family looped-hinge helix DNA binding protein